MSPTIEHSVRKLDESTWLAGRMVVLPEIRASPSSDIVARWTCNDGQIFCTQVADEDILRKAKMTPEFTPQYHAGACAAIWNFAGVIWKVKSWAPGMQREAQTIEFVKKNLPQLPMPDVIYTWTESSINRSFLVMKPVDGRTLEDEWSSLTVLQRKSLASQMADICTTLAQLEREGLGTADGHGTTDEWIQPRDNTKPPWQPRIFGPLTRPEAEAYFSPLKVEKFVFMHGDLAAANIFISQHDEKKITGLIDWEFSGFYPTWWINFKARIGGMALPESADSNAYAWQSLLHSELEGRGILIDMKAWQMWNERRTNSNVQIV